MTNLNRELNGLKYSFEIRDSFEEYMKKALEKNDKKYLNYFETTLSNENHLAADYIDDFFTNSTDSILFRNYLVSEDNKLHLKYSLINNSNDNKIRVILVKELTEEHVNIFEELYSKNKVNEEINKSELLDKIESIKNGLNDLDIDLTPITTKLEELKETINSKDVDLSSLDSKFEEIKQSIQDKDLTVDLSTVNSKIEEIKTALNGLNVDVDLSTLNPKFEEIKELIRNNTSSGSEVSSSNENTLDKNAVYKIFETFDKSGTTIINIGEEITTEHIIVKEKVKKLHFNRRTATINEILFIDKINYETELYSGFDTIYSDESIKVYKKDNTIIINISDYHSFYLRDIKEHLNGKYVVYPIKNNLPAICEFKGETLNSKIQYIQDNYYSFYSFLNSLTYISTYHGNANYFSGESTTPLFLFDTLEEAFEYYRKEAAIYVYENKLK